MQAKFDAFVEFGFDETFRLELGAFVPSERKMPLMRSAQEGSTRGRIHSPENPFH